MSAPARPDDKHALGPGTFWLTGHEAARQHIDSLQEPNVADHDADRAETLEGESHRRTDSARCVVDAWESVADRAQSYCLRSGVTPVQNTTLPQKVCARYSVGTRTGLV